MAISPSEAELDTSGTDFLATQNVFGNGGRPTVGLDVLATKVALDFQAYFPLRAATRSRGVLAVQFDAPHAVAIDGQRNLLAAVASLAAGVLERLHYVDVARARQLQAQTERLRSSILSALSHDIRTPLTALTGLADSLAVRGALSARDVQTAEAIRDQARRLNGLVTNLLNMAKLNAGEIKWSVPLGEYPKLAEQGLKNTGTDNYGGAVVTQNGLLFIGATTYDRKFRVFDKRTGALLWETTLPAAGNATPSTYMVNGKQYIVIACGRGKNDAPSGGTYVAFALP
jgi:K+-sensing histidine kinase KdpD